MVSRALTQESFSLGLHFKKCGMLNTEEHRRLMAGKLGGYSDEIDRNSPSVEKAKIRGFSVDLFDTN